MKLMVAWILLLFIAVASAEGTSYEEQPSVVLGNGIFLERCSICHGNDAMGGGLLPLTMDGYPGTNLFRNKYGKNEEKLRESILWGGAKGDMSPYSPPWADELSWLEVESLILFLVDLYSGNDGQFKENKNTLIETKSSKKVGEIVYRSRCQLCHGSYGEGNGEMARIIVNPGPSNLRLSKVDQNYLNRIIAEGGKKVGRSEKMPPWKDELSVNEVESVVLYLLSLREN